jgi:hypothetical protein
VGVCVGVSERETETETERQREYITTSLQSQTTIQLNKDARIAKEGLGCSSLVVFA